MTGSNSAMVRTSRIEVRVRSASIARRPASCSASRRARPPCVPSPRGAPPAAGQAREQAAHRPPVRREQPLQVARQRLGQRQQPQRLGRRPAVDDDHVPRRRLGGAPHLGEREQVLDAGQHGQLVGDQLVDAGPGEHRAQVLAAASPHAPSSSARVSMCAANRPRSSTSAGSPPSSASERVAEGVRRVGGDDQRLAPGPRRAGRRWPRRGWSCRRRPCP